MVGQVTLDARRNPDGTFAVGFTGNPGGKNGHKKSWQPYGKRLQHWLGKPLEDVYKILRSPQTMKKLSVIDVACLVHIRGLLKGDDIGWERERALNRIEGKVKDVLQIDTPNAHALLNKGDTPTVEEAARTYTEALKQAISPKSEEEGDEYQMEPEGEPDAMAP